MSPFRMIPMLAAAALLAACTRLRVPPQQPHPLERVRVYERLELVDVPYDVLDTVSVRLGMYGDPVNKQTDLQAKAAERGADAVAFLTPLRNADGGYVTYPLADASRRRVEVKALALRLRPPPGEDARVCAALDRQMNRVRELACERAVAADPSDTASLRQLVREKRGWDAPGAVRAAERLVALAPTDPMEQLRLGCALGNDKRWDRAAASFRRAASLDTAFLAPRMILARHLAERAEGDVFPLLAYAQTLAPTAAEVHRLRGRALLVQDRDADALASLDTARTLDPAAWRTRSLRAVALSRLGRHDEAVAEWEQVLRAKPEHFSAMEGSDEFPGEKRAWKRSRERATGARVTVPEVPRRSTSVGDLADSTTCDLVWRGGGPR